MAATYGDFGQELVFAFSFPQELKLHRLRCTVHLSRKQGYKTGRSHVVTRLMTATTFGLKYSWKSRTIYILLRKLPSVLNHNKAAC